MSLNYSPNSIAGLSTDTKPTNIPIGITFFETDTKKTLVWDGSIWRSGLAPLSTTDRGGVPLTGTPSGKFLRDDDTWATPPGGSNAFPVGSVFIAVVSTNPATLLGYGTWSAFGAGKILIGLDSGDTDFDTVEETGGAKTKTIAQANLPDISTGAGTAHTHTQNAHTHVLTELRDATTGGATTNIALTADTSSTIGTKLSGSTTATNQNESAHTHSLGGSGTALNVMNPYIVVYMWKRTL